MSSHQVLPPNAPRDVWLAARRNGIGGSDVAAILGMSRWSSARMVWLEKLGAPEQPPSWPMIRGNYLEPALRDWYHMETGHPVIEVGLHQNVDDPWMQYSPDGFIGGFGLFEAKTTGFFMREEWDEEQVADHAELQVQWGLLVTGRLWADVVVAISDNDPVIRRVYPDKGLQASIREACQQFWNVNVAARIEPPVTWVDADAIKHQFRQARERTAVHGDVDIDQAIKTREHAAQVIKDFTRTCDTADTVIRNHMKDADHLLIDGKVAATWKAQTARVVDMAALAADVDLEQYRTDRLTRVLRVPKVRKPFKEGAL